MARFIVNTSLFSLVKQVLVDFFDKECKLVMDIFDNKQYLLNELK